MHAPFSISLSSLFLSTALCFFTLVFFRCFCKRTDDASQITSAAEERTGEEALMSKMESTVVESVTVNSERDARVASLHSKNKRYFCVQVDFLIIDEEQRLRGTIIYTLTR